jgi:hypothetical protein
LTCRVVASARTVAAHASALLQQTIITNARGAVIGLYAACAQYTVIRRAAVETGGLTMVSAHLPVCQWQAILLTWAHPAHLPAFNAVVGLECDNQVIRKLDTRFSVKSVSLLWYV